MKPIKSSFRKIVGYTLVLFFLVFSAGCETFSPCGTDKKSYVEKFQQFIKKANKTDTEVAEAIWEAMDMEFERLSEECYEQWEDELSLKDKAKIATWVMQYQYIRIGKPIIEEIKK